MKQHRPSTFTGTPTFHADRNGGLLLPLLAAVIWLFVSLPATRCVLAATPVVLGDYDAELRLGEHVDARKMVQRLTELHANTYMWLLWHSPHDWEDLHTFLPLADQAGIEVWVYLVPHSETALQDPRWPYSEPFKVDYIRWAKEIAKLSLQHENLVGYVIDDFWGNVKPGRFAPEYTRRMVRAGKQINPRIKFYPLLYYPQIGLKFVNTILPLVDGVVAAYPNDRKEIERALSFLNDDYVIPPNVAITHPYDTRSHAGDFGVLARQVRVTDARHASITFHYEDDFRGPTAGYHIMQLRIDDRVPWEKDVAGRADGEARVDLSDTATTGQIIQLRFGVLDKKSVSNFGVRARFSGFKTTGLKTDDGGGLENKNAWQSECRGAFTAAFEPEYVGQRKYHVPLIVMPSGSTSEYEQRFHEAGTPERIAGRVRVALDLATAQKVEGVVTYCLDKRQTSKTFDAVRDEYRAFLKRYDTVGDK